MPILIDGNNLMFSLPQRDQSREAVRRLVLELTRHERISVILLFDGPAPEYTGPREHLGSVEILYSGASSADDAIIRILRNSGSPKDWRVVTDDRELRRRARQLGSSILSCSAWKSRRRKKPKIRPRVRPRGEQPLSAREIEEWENFFKAGKGTGKSD